MPDGFTLHTAKSGLLWKKILHVVSHFDNDFKMPKWFGPCSVNSTSKCDEHGGCDKNEKVWCCHKRQNNDPFSVGAEKRFRKSQMC